MASKSATGFAPMTAAMAEACPTPQYEVGDLTQVNQIYTLVNSIYQQMTGQADLKVTDSKSLVAMGDRIDDIGKLDIYLRTLSRRIGLTIDSARAYQSDFSDFKRDSMQFGALVQKLYTHMPEAVQDDAVNVGQMDGQSLDHYIISNPKVEQKIFTKETPYSFFITMQDRFLREAFLSSGAMYSLINYIFQQCQNKMEVVHEDLARLALANLFVNILSKQEYHLVTMYNNATGASITPGTAMFDDKFLRYAIGQINNISRKMKKMSVLYNSEGKVRFTPYEKQTLFLLDDFQTQLETNVEYAAFNEQYVKLRNFIGIPYWQGTVENANINTFDVISSIKLTNGQGAATEKSMCIGCIADWETFGTFRQYKSVKTTPENARGEYYNTFWHEQQMWFNDFGENFVAFYLD